MPPIESTSSAVPSYRWGSPSERPVVIVDMSPSFVSINSVSNDATGVQLNENSLLQNTVAAQTDSHSEESAGMEAQGGQDVQNSGWFEVKKKNRSSSKSSTSKSAAVNRIPVEPARKTQIYSGQDVAEKSKATRLSADTCDSLLHASEQRFAKHTDRENNLEGKGAVQSTDTEVCRLLLLSPPDKMDAREAIDQASTTRMVDAPKFKWGNLEDEDLKQTEQVEVLGEDIIEESPEFHIRTLARTIDSTVCLEGGKQSSAKELNGMQIEEPRQVFVDCDPLPESNAKYPLMHEKSVSETLTSTVDKPQVCQKEEATEEIAEEIFREPFNQGSNPGNILLLHSSEPQQATDTIGSCAKFCVQQQAFSDKGRDVLVPSNLVSEKTLDLTGQFETQRTNSADALESMAAESTFVIPEAQKAVHGLAPGSNEVMDGEKFAKERSMDFSLAASMLMDKFEESESGESKERFRQRLWCYLFENLNRAIDELYFLCELECDMEQIREALLVLKEAGLDFTELKSRVEGFEKAKKQTSTPQNLFAGSLGGSFSGKVEHRRPHAIAWEVRRMACSPHRAEILSSSLEVFKKVQQETAQKNRIHQGKRRDTARLLQIEHSCRELPSKLLPPKELGSNAKEAVTKTKGKQPLTTNSNELLNRVPFDAEKKKAEVLKGNKDLPNSTSNLHMAGSASLKVPLNGKKGICAESIVTLGTSSEGKVVGEVVLEKLTSSVTRTVKGSTVTINQVDKNNKPSELNERRVSIADREKERKWPKTRTSLDAWKVKRNWEDILSSPLRSSSRTSRSPITGRKSTERAKVLHDKLMSPERKKKSPSEMKKEVDEKQARATRIRRELENERVQRLQRTTEKLNRVSEWQAVRSTKLREGMHARQQRGESRHEAHLAQIARRASDESSKVSEVRFITSLNEENKKLSLQQKLQDSELRRAERLQIIKIKQKEDVAREEAVLERRRLLEAERLQRIAETQRKKEDAKARREEERKAASAAREARAVEQVRKKEVRAKAQQEEAEMQAQKLTEKLRESELRRKVYLEQIRERAAMELREQSSPSTRRPSSRDGQLRTAVGQVSEIDAVSDKEVGLSRQAFGSKGTTSVGSGMSFPKSDNMVLQHQALKKRVKKIRQRLMARKYECVEPPLGTEGAGIGSIANAGAARSKIGRWLQDLQRLQQARKAGTSGVGFIIGEMVKYIEGKEAELHAARQAGLVDFIATALPASHTSKPEASQTTLSLLRILKVLLALPANRSYFIARNFLPPLIPMLSTALENFSSLGSSNVVGVANASTLNGSVDKVSSDEKLEAIGEVLEGLLWCVTSIMGHVCSDERQLQMEDDLAELLVACEVIHRLRDLFSLFDRPQMEGAPFPAPVLLGLNLLQTLTGPRGKLFATPHDGQLNMKFELREPGRTSDFVRDIARCGALDILSPIPGIEDAKEEISQHPMVATTTGLNKMEGPDHVEAVEDQFNEVSLRTDQDVQETSASIEILKADEKTRQNASEDTHNMKTVSTDVVNANLLVIVKSEIDLAKPVGEISKAGETVVKNTNMVGTSIALVSDPASPISVDPKNPENNKSEKGQMQQGSAMIRRSTGFLVSAIAETGLVGLPSLLTAVLLQTNPRSTPEQAAAVLPSNFEEVATGVLKVLNNLARLDLALVQNLLAMPDLQMEFFHLVSFLLSHCTCKWNSSTDQVASLLLETLLLLGYFALLHPGNQAVLRWGKSPTILHKICDLPFAFFSDPLLTPVLVGTLLAVCYGSEQNRDVLQQELSMEMLLALLKSSKDEVISHKDIKASEDGFQTDFQSNPVLSQASQMDAIVEESEEEMQQVQEKYEFSHVKEEGKRVNGDAVISETEVTSGSARRQVATRSSAGKSLLSDSISSPNKRITKITSKTAEGEASSKDLVGGRGNFTKNNIRGSPVSASSENITSQMKKIKGMTSSLASDCSGKTSTPSLGTVSNKRMTVAVPQDQVSSTACGVSSIDSADAKDSCCNSFLPPAFMLQNRFPVSLLDLAQDFFSVGL